MTSFKGRFAPPLPRKIYIDWMKIIGIYLVVAGHFFPIYNQYVYVVSAPLFFFISGFLSKIEKGSDLCTKIVRNLVFPMLFFVVIYFVEGIVTKTIREPSDVLRYWGGFLIGDQKILKVCWFIYTLILLKVLLQIVNDVRKSLVVLILFIIIGYWLSAEGLYLQWSVANVVVAYPFFQTGFLFKKFVEPFLVRMDDMSLFPFILILSVLLGIVFLSGYYNGVPMLYRNHFGENYFLYYVGGIAGTLLALIIAIKIKINNKILLTLSGGTIVILGFHSYAIRLISYVDTHYLDISNTGFIAYIWSVLIVVSFYPVIVVCSKYFPFILGNRLKRNGVHP